MNDKQMKNMEKLSKVLTEIEIDQLDDQKIETLKSLLQQEPLQHNLLKVIWSMSAEKIKDIEKLADLVSDIEVRNLNDAKLEAVK